MTYLCSFCDDVGCAWCDGIPGAGKRNWKHLWLIYVRSFPIVNHPKGME